MQFPRIKKNSLGSVPMMECKINPEPWYQRPPHVSIPLLPKDATAHPIFCYYSLNSFLGCCY